MPSPKKVVFIVVLAAAVAGGVYGFRHWEASRSVPETVAWGTVDSRSVDLAFEASGRIEKLYKDEGDRVEPGELLGELDTRALKIERDQAAAQLAGSEAELNLALEGYRKEEIEAARAQMESARANLELAQSTLKRTQKLKKSNVASEQDLDQALATERADREALAAAQADFERLSSGLRPEEINSKRAARDAAQAALRSLDYQIETASLLTSPSRGVIRSRILEPGDMAGPTKRVFEISLTDPKWVRVYITETQLAFVKEGSSAVVTTDTTPPFAATVGFIASQAEFTPKTVQTQDLRTVLVYEVRLTVADPENILRLGQPVTVDFAPSQFKDKP